MWGTKEELGQAVGKAERSGIAITDSGFAGRIRIMLEEETEGKGLVIAIIIVVILILLTCGFFVYEYFFGI